MPIDHFCLSCAMTFATVAGLTMHAKAKDHIANPFVCDACEISFASCTALESHMSSPKHADDDESEDDLDVSDDGVSNNGTFGDSESTDSDRYCDGCERQFIDITALNQHLFNSLKHNWCFDCSRDFGSKDSLLQHQNSLAHRGRNFECPFCSRTVKNPSAIAPHIESGCREIADEFSCPKCKAEFQLISGFVQHLESRACGLSDRYFNDLTAQFSRLLKA